MNPHPAPDDLAAAAERLRIAFAGSWHNAYAAMPRQQGEDMQVILRDYLRLLPFIA